ncbi:sulfite exporter TauE/SafE family protein [Cupriavidus gilardii]|uniref:Probable membrane transporter protein n=1 Tax=Cupriavidus gilardii TaxID=82541 RepID=A0A6N1BBB7_9BURK|nr:sulfite exporter TauE/SafE family protein [Cupriavidus gilardii]ALD93338.1 membrane protein [Cupriavidus gilardii CR3]KAB0599261.1 sulfite exporter TauE/SafE family protein [Cupriavidus gilardii]MCT9013275.1 sulfite exporter TauE/SafE family protein [Cupriavidus gilardii]MCT9052829.1 sulfite exporter TauE/SafE family protein [Cupriavidus gilardii]MCT9070633.1 sulfite exporter TauE/SafE family protein [Cupriavidus gilardii]
MNVETLLPVLALLGLGSYFQTVTGFGMGLIVMGAASGLHLAPVATLAALVSLLTLANGALALPGKLHHIDWRAVRAATLGILPSVVAGVVLLHYLSGTAAGVLQLMLGAVVLYGGIGAALRPAALPSRSGDGSFFVSGVCGGLLSGLFGVSGPPLIFQFYRQPLNMVQIRCALILVFTTTSAVRTAYSAWQGELAGDVWLQAALAFPVVALSTIAARRFPPPLSTEATRRLAFGVLVVLGAYLMGGALWQWFMAYSA